MCISGHREKSIIPYEQNYRYLELTIQVTKCLLARYIDISYSKGYDTFITGFATGSDLWASEHILKRRKQGYDMKLIGAIPYLHHADHFSRKYIDMLYQAEKNAQSVVLISQNPDISYFSHPLNKNQSNELYRNRNYFMIDHSCGLIAFIDKRIKYSGTLQTVNYAKRKNINILNFGLDHVYSLIREYKTIEKIKSAIQNID